MIIFAMFDVCHPGCPSQCSGKGTCVNNTCECLDGWSGEDCREGNSLCMNTQQESSRTLFQKRVKFSYKYVAPGKLKSCYAGGCPLHFDTKLARIG